MFTITFDDDAYETAERVLRTLTGTNVALLSHGQPVPTGRDWDESKDFRLVGTGTEWAEDGLNIVGETLDRDGEATGDVQQVTRVERVHVYY